LDVPLERGSKRKTPQGATWKGSGGVQGGHRQVPPPYSIAGFTRNFASSIITIIAAILRFITIIAAMLHHHTFTSPPSPDIIGRSVAKLL
jgi:hypothetical protein